MTLLRFGWCGGERGPGSRCECGKKGARLRKSGKTTRVWNHFVSDDDDDDDDGALTIKDNLYTVCDGDFDCY